MRNRISVFAAILLSAVVLVAWVAAPAAQESIEGTWITTSDGNSHQRGVFLFTSDGSYSMMYVRGDSPRENLGANPSDADIRASMSELTANSGRVTIEGNEINYEANMANNAAYMNAWPDNDQTATFEVDGETMMLTLGQGESSGTFQLVRPG